MNLLSYDSMRPATTRSEHKADAAGNLIAAVLYLNMASASLADAADTIINHGNPGIGAAIAAVGLGMLTLGGKCIIDCQKAIGSIIRMKSGNINTR